MNSAWPVVQFLGDFYVIQTETNLLHHLEKLNSKKSVKSEVKARYSLLTVSLLAGDVKIVDCC